MIIVSCRVPYTMPEDTIEFQAHVQRQRLAMRRQWQARYPAWHEWQQHMKHQAVHAWMPLMRAPLTHHAREEKPLQRP